MLQPNLLPEQLGKPVLFDIEVFPNYVLVLFSDGERRRAFRLRAGDSYVEMRQLLKLFVCDRILIGYNNEHFDNVLLKAFFHGKINTPAEWWQLVKRIIELEGSPWQDEWLKTILWLPAMWKNSIDVMLIHKKDLSLKELEVRMKMLSVQDLPFKPGTLLSVEQMKVVDQYCEHDLQALHTLYKQKVVQDAILTRLKLTEMFKQDGLLSLSEPQLAEKIICAQYEKRTGQKPKTLAADHVSKPFLFGDCLPPIIRFRNADLQTRLETWKWIQFSEIDREGNKALVNETIEIGPVKLTMGVGGLHSVDRPGIFKSNDEAVILDADVASYYPALVINYKLHPPYLTDQFTYIYKEIRDERLVYKAKGEDVIANSLKIVVNSTYGKFGAWGSPIFDLKSAYSVTLTGQLGLIMLIEWLNDAGIFVITANTDGVTCLVKKEQRARYDAICKEWEALFQFQMEFTQYEMFVRQSVNSYFATYQKKGERKLKLKGEFLAPDLTKKQDAVVVREAVLAYFLEGRDVVEYIDSETDLFKFLYSYRAMRGSTVVLYDCAAECDTELQQTNRWYVSNDDTILLKRLKTGKMAQVPNGQGSVSKGTKGPEGDYGVTLANELETNSIPANLRRNPYIAEAKRLIRAITKPIGPKARRQSFAASVPILEGALQKEMF